NCLTEHMPREDYLRALASGRVVLTLPHLHGEGAFLPTLEAMYLGVLVVTPQYVGNNLFCRSAYNGFHPRYERSALVSAVQDALSLPPALRASMLANAQQTVAAHQIQQERERFLAVMQDLDEIWQDFQAKPALKRLSIPPKLTFLGIGGQKCGTSSLYDLL